MNSLRQRLREVIVLMADLPDSALDVPDAFHVSLSYRMTAWETLGGDAPATPIAAAKMIRRQYEELEEKTRKATVDAVLRLRLRDWGCVTSRTSWGSLTSGSRRSPRRRSEPPWQTQASEDDWLAWGMTWESSAEYYRVINECVKRRLGGLHSARCLMLSVDFGLIEELQTAGRWEEAGKYLGDCARQLELGGAELVVLCTNTMHKVADEIAAATNLPFLHIADATAERIVAQGITSVGLLGTRYTMEQDFYRGRLADAHGLEVMIPPEADRAVVHEVIFRELVLGKVRPESRKAYREIISKLVEMGAQAIILGCTEIGLLLRQEDATVPLFDTTVIHAERAVELALA